MTVAILASPATAQESPRSDLAKRATSLFEASYLDQCDSAEDMRATPIERMEKFEFNYVPIEETETGPEKVIVYRFACSWGSYWLEHVYFWWREYRGLQPLFFAKPTYDAEFEIGGDPTSTLLSVEVTGFTSNAEMINSEVNVLAGTISEEHREGAMGYVRRNTWVLDANGEFRLTKVSIDPNNDSDMDPVILLNYPHP